MCAFHISNKEDIVRIATDFLDASAYNFVAQDEAIRPDLAGMRIYEDPLVGCASAEDAYLSSLADNEAANITMPPPKAWLTSAATVISVFLPYTERIRASNRGGDTPSDEWLHGRIQGQECNKQLTLYLRNALIEHGFAAMIPNLDGRFWSAEATRLAGRRSFSSNWSERHAAYAAGLGTFSLSKGVITEKGVAGRFGSVITSLRLDADPRPYADRDGACIRCGQCAENCPVRAIDRRTGKSHPPCSQFLKEIKTARSTVKFPYYGCGKCQTAVPCEHRNPRKR
ncbi:MAG: 4Fe-4S binding protein [Clostridiales Family XIII bacterium]|nr:4Fe-4S binding protein [Clostridiales Family XIII bacterium]